jgi:hypothetical protein
VAFSFSCRRLAVAAMTALAAAGAGCSADAEAVDEASRSDITSVAHTDVKRQSIGNCWVYVTTSWLEALNQGATGQKRNTSESWITYWHWFEQITNAGGSSDTIETGGAYAVAADLITRYGLMNEADFIPSEGNDEMSRTQKRALEAINRSLASGKLSAPEVRMNRARVRKELDRAWGLSDEQIARMNAVFGPGVERTLDASESARSVAAANGVVRASEFEARLKDPDTGAFVTGTLADALGTSRGSRSLRAGKFAWQTVYYPFARSERRAFWRRVQRALHDRQPVVTSWMIDFNALGRDSKVTMANLERLGPGSQGGHMTVMQDYQADVPGIGLLRAGEQATPEQMEAALADGTKIEFVRVKNSWGVIRPDRWDSAAIMGYQDLDLAYLDGPIKECETNPDGTTDTTKCETDTTPLWDVMLPAGY